MWATLKTMVLIQKHEESLQCVKQINGLIEIVLWKNYACNVETRLKGQKWISPQYAAHSSITLPQLEVQSVIEKLPRESWDWLISYLELNSPLMCPWQNFHGVKKEKTFENGFDVLTILIYQWGRHDQKQPEHSLWPLPASKINHFTEILQILAATGFILVFARDLMHSDTLKGLFLKIYKTWKLMLCHNFWNKNSCL